jgi:surface protein
MIIKINKDNKDIRNYLEIDSNIYKKNSLSKYKNEDIYILHFPKSETAYISYGNGIEQEGKYDIKHNCYTDHGSSGAPILSASTNKVIGIHKGFVVKESGYFNIGTFLKFPFDELNPKLIGDSKGKRNYIVAELCIKEEDINKDIRILNSYEKSSEYNFKKNLRENLNFSEFTLKKEEYMNENEIKKCQITINDEPIPFNYFHKFKSKGKYTIKYSFKDFLTRTNNMFFECSFLTNIDLSNFDSENVTNISEMFLGCSSLINIDLSNFNTEKVTNMSFMFNSCSSLLSLNLSDFHTNNVTNMSNMFSKCSSLIFLDLSNFNTNNVNNMTEMFYGCSSLNSLDLSTFNTTNVNNMAKMFSDCSSLSSINLSNFNTNNVKDMSDMFYNCSSLNPLDISNFNTNNVINMSKMFSYCSSLVSLNLSNFNTINVNNMNNMFSNCISLISLDLSNFNTNNVQNYKKMFDNINKTCKIITSDNNILHKMKGCKIF